MHLRLEPRVRPPLLAGPGRRARPRRELVAVALRASRCRSCADLDRPEAAAAGLVAQVGVLVGGADEDALARLDHLEPAVARPVALDRAGDEGSSAARLGLAHGVHLGDLDQPFAAQVLRDVLAGGDVGQVVGEPLAGEDAQAVDFQPPCGPSSTSM